MSATRTASDDTTESRVLVLGSANVDSYVHVDHFPAPGETVFGVSGTRSLGGKGANQAVAASMSGATTTFVGMVGQDADASLVRSVLAEHRVDVRGILVSRTAPTGTAVISVDGAAENTIVVVSGANAELTADALDSYDVDQLIARTTPAIALTQGELRPETIAAFAASCRRANVRFVLNLAPTATLPPETLCAADPLILNEGEATALLGSDHAPVIDVDSAIAAARELRATTAASVVITLGGAGAVAANPDGAWHEPAPRPEQVVDTTGAGDAFVGALAAALARGASLATAVRAGVAAGSAAVGARGTIDAYGSLADLAVSTLVAEVGR